MFFESRTDNSKSSKSIHWMVIQMVAQYFFFHRKSISRHCMVYLLFKSAEYQAKYIPCFHSYCLTYTVGFTQYAWVCTARGDFRIQDQLLVQSAFKVGHCIHPTFIAPENNHKNLQASQLEMNSESDKGVKYDFFQQECEHPVSFVHAALCI